MALIFDVQSAVVINGQIAEVSGYAAEWHPGTNSVCVEIHPLNVDPLMNDLRSSSEQQQPREDAHAAGLPEGVLRSLHAGHDDLARLIGDNRIRFVSLTGSVAGGAAEQRVASRQFLATNLELGGKDPAYVRPDAPLEATIENLVDGAYFNAGQLCCAVERVYVHQEPYCPFVDGFIDLTRRYRFGNPLDPATTLGPMVWAVAAALVRESDRRGRPPRARAMIDSREFTAARDGKSYVAPQVLLDVDHGMRDMTRIRSAQSSG